MGLLNDVIQDDGEAFTDPDVFGEAVTFTPISTGVGVSYNANVVRHTPEELAQGDWVPKMEIWLRRDAAGLVGPASVNSGGDTVTVAYRYGGTAEAFHITVPEDQDTGMFHLQIR